MNYDQFYVLFICVQVLLFGGVNLLVCVFKLVGGELFFVQCVDGLYLYDVDGNCYIDYVGLWGLMIVGYNYLVVCQVVKCVIDNGLFFGVLCEVEVVMVEMFIWLVLLCEMVCMVNFGIEVMLLVICLVWGVIGCSCIVKFEGCYYGYGDLFLVKVGSGMLMLGVFILLGVLVGLSELILILFYNDFDVVIVLFVEQGEYIVGLIIELVVGNVNCILLCEGYLQYLCVLCMQYGMLLIFDEVMIGFCVVFGGVQVYYGIIFDLIMFGKIIGGGMLVGVYGGCCELMLQIVFVGLIYQVGILSGNLVVMVVGLVMFELVQELGFYDCLSVVSVCLCVGFEDVVVVVGVVVIIMQVGVMFGLFFIDQKVDIYVQVVVCDIGVFNCFFYVMFECGVFLVFLVYEVGFLFSVYDDSVINVMIVVVCDVFKVVNG